MGRVFVHWTFTVKERRAGWLGDAFHRQFREILLHALGRYSAVCPAYCLMRDHVHLLVLGREETCHQRTLIRFLRKHTNAWLRERGFEWQKQPHDHVLRQKDREKDAFQKLVAYVLNNPVRRGCVERWEDWPYLDSIVPGYPEVTLRDEDFWERFWRIYHSSC